MKPGKATTIDQRTLAEFEAKLRRKPTYDVYEVLCDLENTPSGGDEEYLIPQRSLPSTIPLPIRKALADRTRAAFDILNGVQDILGALSAVAVKVHGEKEKEEGAKKPHCGKCGQLIVPKKYYRR